MNQCDKFTTLQGTLLSQEHFCHNKNWLTRDRGLLRLKLCSQTLHKQEISYTTLLLKFLERNKTHKRKKISRFC